MGESYPIRGNVVRLSYESRPGRGFYDLMHAEGSAVSMGNGRFVQFSHAFYWRGAVITHGHTSSRRGPSRELHSTLAIEIQKDGPMEDLDALVAELSSKMGVTFKRRTVRRAEE